MATLQRQQADGVALEPVQRAYLRQLEQDAPRRQAERQRMARRALTVAKSLQKALRRLIARLQRKTSGDPGETQRQLQELEAALSAVDQEIVGHTAELAELSGTKKEPKKKPKSKGAKVPAGPPAADAPATGAATRHVSPAVAASTAVHRSGLLGADALAWATRGVLHPWGGLLSSWASFALSGGPDDPRTIATSSQGFAPQSTSRAMGPPVVPLAVAAACKPACCKDCPPGATCACPPPDAVVAEGSTVTEGGGTGGGTGGGGGGGGGGVGSGGGVAAGPTADVPVRAPPETTPSQPNVRSPLPPPPDIEDVDDPVEDGDEPPIVRLHPELVAAREAQLELDRLVEAFWALVDEVNRLLELLAPPSFSDLGGQYALRARATFDRPLKILKGRLHEATEAMNLLLGEHEHLSDQHEAGWTGSIAARSRAVDLFDALRSVAVQSAMAVEAAAHFRVGAALAEKGADFRKPGWRAARRVADTEFRAADLILERMVDQFGDRRVPVEDMEHWAATTALRVDQLEIDSIEDRRYLESKFLEVLEVSLAVLEVVAVPGKSLGAVVRASTRARLAPLMRAGGPAGLGGRAGMSGRAAMGEGSRAAEAVESGLARAGKPLRVPDGVPWRYAEPGELRPGVLGQTSSRGDIVIRRGLNPQLEAETIRHEAVHRFLTPLGEGSVATARQKVGSWFYENSVVARLAEEGIAEGYATRSVLRGITFPFKGGYSLAPGLGDAALAVGAGGATYLLARRPEGSR